MDLKCEWFTEPLKAKVVEEVTEYEDIYLEYSCPLCKTYMPDLTAKTPPNRLVSEHLTHKNGKHGLAKFRNTQQHVRAKTRRRHRFVDRNGPNTTKRWACCCCLEYFENKQLHDEHFKEEHDPREKPVNNGTTPNNPPTSTTRKHQAKAPSVRSAVRIKGRSKFKTSPSTSQSSRPSSKNKGKGKATDYTQSSDDQLVSSTTNMDTEGDSDDDFQKPLPMPAPRLTQSSDDQLVSSTTNMDTEGDSDDDFQKPLPMPAPRPLLPSSPRNKGKGKARLEDMLPPRPKLERDASYVRGLIADINIEQDSYPSSSGNNTASTSSTSNSMVSSSNATSPASLDETENELDGVSAAPTPTLVPSSLTEFDSGSQQVSDKENQTQASMNVVNRKRALDTNSTSTKKKQRLLTDFF